VVVRGIFRIIDGMKGEKNGGKQVLIIRTKFQLGENPGIGIKRGTDVKRSHCARVHLAWL